MLHPLLRRSLAWVLVAAAACLPGVSARAADDAGLDRLKERLLQSTVLVLYEREAAGPDKRHFANGTGVLVDVERRLVVTSYHVGPTRDNHRAFFPIRRDGSLVTSRDHYAEAYLKGEGIRCRTLLRDVKRDLAVLQLESLPPGVPALPIARQRAVAGLRVVALGNPAVDSKMWVFRSGKVQRVGPQKFQSEAGGEPFTIEAQVIETDFPGRQGDSGGPLVNERGELVGITQGHRDTKGIYIDLVEVRAVLDGTGLLAKVPEKPRPDVKDPPKPVGEKPPSKPALSAEKINQRLLGSGVWVVVLKSPPDAAGKFQLGTGTGALIDVNRRLVLTNWHVVRDKEPVIFFPAFTGGSLVAERSHYMDALKKGGGIRGKVIARDLKRDLALIQLDSLPRGAVALPLAAEPAAAGDRVHSLGNPGSSDRLWVFSSRNVQEVVFQKIKAQKEGDIEFELEARVVKTDAPPKPGESGGPLVNDRGELVGVTQGHGNEVEVGIFVDLSEVRWLLESKGLLAKLPVTKPPDPGKEPPVVKPPEGPEETEQAAARRLRLAKLLIDGGKAPRAKEILEEILKTYPSTKTAQEARQLLEKLEK